jgi:tetratricopeptide (TPR) repeat protein
LSDNDIENENFYYEEGLKAIEKAEEINVFNPVVMAVKLLSAYTRVKYYLSHIKEFKIHLNVVDDLEKAVYKIKVDRIKELEEVCKKRGFIEKFFLVKAMLTENPIERASLLLTILERFDPDNAEVHNLLGVTYYFLNNKNLALEMFERAKRLSPNFGKPYLNLGLYKEASDRDVDLEPLVSYYSILLEVKEKLLTFYSVLIFSCMIFFSLNYRRLFFLCSFLIMVTYIAFEIFIHFVRPINDIDHMFPVSFPFF